MASAHQLISALRSAHDKLVEIVESPTKSLLSEPSYCSDWNVAAVLSHIGSGAEINLALVESALEGGEPPGRPQNEQIWDRWNAYDAETIASRWREADEALVAKWEGLPDNTLETFSVEAFGGRTLDAAGLLEFRLGEVALHSFDIAVVRDDSAGVDERSAEFLLEPIARRAGGFVRGPRPATTPCRLLVQTTRPERSGALDIGAETVSLSFGPENEGPSDGRLAVPAEALIRLLYGRLDANHTPDETHIDGSVTLDELRALFPGF